jgi:Cytochrome c3
VLLLAAAPVWSQKTHELCASCHTEQVEAFLTHPHAGKGLSCDNCHGKSEKHRLAAGAASPDRVAAPDEVPGLCGACHIEQRKQYEQSKHGRLVLAQSKTKAANCETCHGVHSQRDAAAVVKQCQKCHASLPESCKASPAVHTAKVECMSCHAKHTLLAGKR